MNVINPTPILKRTFSLKYRRCRHQWEKVHDYIDEGEQWYEVYCAKCDSPMYFSKAGIEKLKRIAEIREEYGNPKALRHFFMFETEGDVVEKKETPAWHSQLREALEYGMRKRSVEYVRECSYDEPVRESVIVKQDYYNEIVSRRLEAEKYRRDLEELENSVERLQHLVTAHYGSNGRWRRK